MKKIYEKPDVAVTVISSADMTNAIVLSSIHDLTAVEKTKDNTVTFPTEQ